ncbi:D-alanyl-lipoteichoic acid acyltransferase DltB, MBOAT superfamily [Acetitomaculum ruminis DSM 5522]|uniref:D-alanyl-lipoteichoic acid acyltransferase DltB, MBOAT superfamily n=1 Tax=Acetitomaculum ruminis DSM 5522 TaxID=1120918 RepID=A0A1I0WFD7_9FIRM|nr:MBOAT family O-acyltransferase [Acetitomaculum ruminis]SFA86948.1 D-alanyl-lipoteichoic acid acyltransferase DltB, MBOAT superfamily [Acetitomaculum ruminis DSM 5522]
MTYISMYYYFLVLAVLIIYYLFPIKHRWIALLVGNIGFYFLFYKTGWWIFGITIIISFFAGIALQGFEGKTRKLILILALLAIIAPWFLSKNFNFILKIAQKDPIQWITPLGISFYTLQLISYLVDVYNKKIAPQRNIAHFVLYASFFPQLIQGPIPRYEQLQNQLITGNKFEEKNIVKGFCYIIWGFFLKLMIADKAAVVVDTVFGNYPAYSGGFIWLASILYSVQLYADFLACTTLAQGVSKMFGIEIIDNFARPYFATSVKDFWRRWHISLSSWLKDYIYIPLGGNRKGIIRKYIYLAITFLVSGIWHGAGYKFLVWGGIHAFYQIAGDITHNKREELYEFLNVSAESRKKKILKQIGTFMLINWAWIIFRADSLRLGIKMIKHMFTEFNPWIFWNNQIFTLGLEWKEMMILLFSIVLLWKVGLYHEKGLSISDSIMKQRLVIRWSVYMIAIIGIMVFGTYGFGFNAQDFIYGGF